MKIIIGEFVRQNFLSKNTEVSEAEVLRRVEEACGRVYNNTRAGYRDGVVLVSIDPTGFKSRVVELKDGDYLFGKFQKRREGETPRKKVGVLRNESLPDAKFVDVVLYSAAVLREDPLNVIDDDVDYEIVAVLAKDIEDEPIETEVLMHNHFGSDGGTATGMSDAEFVAALRKSFSYWKNRAFIN